MPFPYAETGGDCRFLLRGFTRYTRDSYPEVSKFLLYNDIYRQMGEKKKNKNKTVENLHRFFFFSSGIFRLIKNK